MFAGPLLGYAAPMSDSQDAETKPGPASPREEGLETPTPPGGPQRQDVAGGPLAGQDLDAPLGTTSEQTGERSGGHTIAIEEEQPGGAPAEVGDEVQEENAGTSMDQPSQ